MKVHQRFMIAKQKYQKLVGLSIQSKRPYLRPTAGTRPTNFAFHMSRPQLAFQKMLAESVVTWDLVAISKADIDIRI